MVRRSLSILFWAIFFFLLAVFVVGGRSIEVWWSQEITATLATNVLREPHEAVTIDFSRAIQEKTLEGKIALTPNIPFHTEWQSGGKRLMIVPDTVWPLGATYRVIIGQGRTRLFQQTPRFSFSVRSPMLPQIVSVTPKNGDKDVLLGIEDPIRVTFDRSTRDFYIDFQFDPPVEVVYQNNAEKTVFEMLPKRSLQAGETYAINIQARYRNEEGAQYYPLQKVSFATLLPQPKQMSRDFAGRIEEAKRFTQAQYSEGKYIDVNLASQTMTLFENGQSIDAYIISSGKPGMDTPRGRFSIENKAARPWSKQYGLYMPYWQAITPDGKYGIHELPEWPSGYKEGANHLGIPVSHGCMRLGIGPAKRVFEWADIGTPVVIH